MDGVQIKNVPAAFVGSGVTYAFGSTCGAGSKSGGGMGDPHFKTWNNTYFDFHGQCDMVLLSNPSFDGGAGLEVHVRKYRSLYLAKLELIS